MVYEVFQVSYSIRRFLGDVANFTAWHAQLFIFKGHNSYTGISVFVYGLLKPEDITR